MKLRNKKTGEIITDYEIRSNVGVDADAGVGNILLFVGDYPRKTYSYNSLAELNEEWCDYEEPKEYWYIDYQGMVRSASKEENDWFKENEIGNCFETKEEAEKAVEKLKAWKRLKDKEFRFIDHIDRDSGQGMTRYEWDGYVNGEDLDLLFGGEE